MAVLGDVRFGIDEKLGEIFSQSIVVFEPVPDRVEQRTGRPHVPYRSPRASPAMRFDIVDYIKDTWNDGRY